MLIHVVMLQDSAIGVSYFYKLDNEKSGQFMKETNLPIFDALISSRQLATLTLFGVLLLLMQKNAN